MKIIKLKIYPIFLPFREYGQNERGMECIMPSTADFVPQYFLYKYNTLGTGLGEKIDFGLNASQCPISRKPPFEIFKCSRDALELEIFLNPLK